MATAAQLKSLIRTHFSEDKEHFTTVALQVAAHEAKKGHTSLANDIRKIIDTERVRNKTKVLSLPVDLKGLISTHEPEVARSSIVLNENLKNRLDRIIHEYRQKHKIKSHGLQHRRKVLLIGPPGTGKTMTAKVLAHELSLPLFRVEADRLVTKYMGETSAKLRQVFDYIKLNLGVYLFDEFDAIGGERSSENDVGEMRRVLNSFLQFIEQDSSDSLIIAATNTFKLLDSALIRRFDDVLLYEKPNNEEIKRLIRNRLSIFKSDNFDWNIILDEAKELSHAEIVLSCNDAIKQLILNDEEKIEMKVLLESIRTRSISQK